MDPFQSLRDYESFVYKLKQQLTIVQRSTLVVVPRGRRTADLTLASTHPHHKHILPNIKRNRIPASNMSFERPNLPVLIAEFEELIKGEENDDAQE